MKPTPQQIAAMSLPEFARAGLVARVKSDILDDEVVFASDNVPAESLRGLGSVVYRARELAELAACPPGSDALRIAHEVKRALGGSIQGVRPRGGQR